MELGAYKGGNSGSNVQNQCYFPLKSPNIKFYPSKGLKFHIYLNKEI